MRYIEINVELYYTCGADKLKAILKPGNFTISLF